MTDTEAFAAQDDLAEFGVANAAGLARLDAEARELKAENEAKVCAPATQDVHSVPHRFSHS